MDLKLMTLGLMLLSPFAHAGGQWFPPADPTTLEAIQAREDAITAKLQEPIDYQYGYGTKTTITELPGGRVDVQQHMGNGYDEVKVIDYDAGVYDDYDE